MIDALKERIKSIPVLGWLARKIWIYSFSRYRTPAYWISKIAYNPNAMIVQIGSNDGIISDPIRELLQKNKFWRALFVEPIPYLFGRLQENYEHNQNYIFVNAAINEGKAMPFYCVDPSINEHIEKLPFWFEQLGSFNRQHILKYLGHPAETYIKEMEVRCMTLNELIAEKEIKQIDILHIDAEGYDWKILSQLDLSRFEPSIILYEHEHLSEGEKKKSINFLKKQYFLFYLYLDIIAINKKETKAANAALWRLRNQRITDFPLKEDRNRKN